MSDAFRIRYGPWALVAGASEGLGAEFARQLAARGLDLVLVARRGALLEERAEALRREFGHEVRTRVLDLGGDELPAALHAMAGELEIGLGIYNAALSLIGPFLERELDDALRALDVNCRGPLVLAHELGRAMAKRGRGGIVLMSSLAGYQGSAWIAAYAATKAFDLVLAEGLWDELRERGVDVLASCAGATRTPNYERTKPRGGVAPMEPPAVVADALAALGRKPTTIPGRANRAAAFAMRRLLPRRGAIRIMSRTTRSMYDR